MSRHWLGKKHTEEAKEKMSEIRKKNPNRYWLGKKRPTLSQETKEKISFSLKGHIISQDTKEKISLGNIGKNLGEKSPRYIMDRTQLKTTSEANQARKSFAYSKWRKEVWKRDNFKCKIANKECKGRIEAHHILGFTAYPELRYEINNGITLCLAHHPRKRAEEKRLSPLFMELVSVSKE